MHLLTLNNIMTQLTMTLSSVGSYDCLQLMFCQQLEHVNFTLTDLTKVFSAFVLVFIFDNPVCEILIA